MTLSLHCLACPHPQELQASSNREKKHSIDLFLSLRSYRHYAELGFFPPLCHREMTNQGKSISVTKETIAMGSFCYNLYMYTKEFTS